MAEYEISQKLLSLGPTYQVYDPAGQLLYTIKGKLLSFTPNLTMVEGADGSAVASMTGNMFRTSFTMSGAEQAVLTFPLFGFLKKRFTLEVGGQTYEASGGFTAYSFSCGAFSVNKKLALKDKFQLHVDDDFPQEVAMLATVAIDQKFFESND